MPVLSRLKVALACGAALSAVLLGLWVFHLSAENKRLGGAVDALSADLATERKLREADQLVATRYAARLAALSTAQETTRANLNRALQVEPAWSSERLPDSVADALGLRDYPEARGTSPAVPTGLPSATSAGKD